MISLTSDAREAGSARSQAAAGHSFSPGDWVIYRKPKASKAPGPRARGVAPARFGEDYRYYVEKFWVVVGFEENGQLRVRTRRGKQHVLAPGDLNLRRARWWERLVYRNRFRDVEAEMRAENPTESNADEQQTGSQEN